MRNSTEQPVFPGEATMIRSSGQFLWCKFSHHSTSSAADVMSLDVEFIETHGFNCEVIFREKYKNKVTKRKIGKYTQACAHTHTNPHAGPVAMGLASSSAPLRAPVTRSTRY